MKNLLFSILIFVSFYCNAQDIVPLRTAAEFKESFKEQTYYNTYKGRVIEFDKNNLFRAKTYGKRYIQFTYIKKLNNNVDVRLYMYYNIYTALVTPAVSLRFRINITK